MFSISKIHSYIHSRVKSWNKAVSKYVSFNAERFIADVLRLDPSGAARGTIYFKNEDSAISIVFSNRDDFLFIASKWKPETLHPDTKGLSLRWREILPTELLWKVVLIDETNPNWKKTLAHELRHARNKILMSERFPEYAEGSIDSMLVLAKDELIAYLSNPDKTTEDIFSVLSKMGGMYFYPMNNYYFAGIPKEKRDAMWKKYLPKLKRLCDNANKVKELQHLIPKLDYLDLLALTPSEKWKYLPNFIKLIQE